MRTESEEEPCDRVDRRPRFRSAQRREAREVISWLEREQNIPVDALRRMQEDNGDYLLQVD